MDYKDEIKQKAEELERLIKGVAPRKGDDFDGFVINICRDLLDAGDVDNSRCGFCQG